VPSYKRQAETKDSYTDPGKAEMGKMPSDLDFKTRLSLAL
jgi:hypothetical protein